MAAKKIIYGHDASEAIRTASENCREPLKLLWDRKAVMSLLKKVLAHLS